MIVQPYTPPTDEYRKLRFAWSDSENIKSQYTPECQMSQITPTVGNNVTLDVTKETDSSMLGANINNMTDADVRTLTVGDFIKHEDALNAASDSLDTSIITALAKPSMVSQGTLSSGDTSSTFGTAYVMGALSGSAYWTSKLKGVYAIRATEVITLQVNASRFQSGRYILAYLPTGGNCHDSTNTTWLNMKRADLMTVTQLPHVEIDIGTETEVTLRIPYTSWNNAFPVPTVTNPTPTYASPGSYFLYPYKPLVAGSGVSTADYTIYIHYEDVVLKTAITSQMGDITEEEQTSSGPISSGIKTVQRQVGYAGVMLDSVLSNTNWFLDACCGVATFLGFSKPINLNKVESRTLQIHNSFSTYDGLDNSIPLSSCQTNSLIPDPGYSGSKVDPLTIDFIKSIPAYEGQFNWTSAGGSAAAGTLLTTINVRPGNNYFQYTGGSGYNYITQAPMAYLNQLYSFYRGSITYKFKFVKNEFYSGRLLVGFLPVDLDSTAPPAPVFGIDTQKMNKTIIDVRQCKEFEISVPYAALTPFLSTGDNFNFTGLYDPGIAYAKVYVWILNPLLAPTSVAPSIDIVYESYGNKDLEFAVPKRNNFCVYANAAIQMGKIEFQSGELTTGIISVPVAGGNNKSLSMLDSARCMGEVQLSLRQLLKRPNMLKYSTSPDLMWFWKPFYNSIATPGAVNPTQYGSMDMYAHLCGIFALRRGGVNVKIVPNQSSSAPQICFANLQNYGNSGQSIFPITHSNSYPSSIAARFNGANSALTRLDWGVSYRIPYYQSTSSIPNPSSFLDGTTVQYLGQLGRSNTELQFYFGDSYSGQMHNTFYRYGADDCDFGLWTGIPPMILVPDGTSPT